MVALGGKDIVFCSGLNRPILTHRGLSLYRNHRREIVQVIQNGLRRCLAGVASLVQRCDWSRVLVQRVEWTGLVAGSMR